MSIAASMLPEFDHETANTRKMLERVPEAKFGWKPHEKSFTLGQLASHLANVPTWMAPTILQSELDFAPVGGEPFTTPQASSTAELVKFFDDNTAAAREVFADAADATFMENWSLLGGGQVHFTMPKIAGAQLYYEPYDSPSGAVECVFANAGCTPRMDTISRRRNVSYCIFLI
ncbi:MAG: DinB family protein [Calditrichia bacterium]